jgi:tetratricopeptide (TPR) repeat protein
MDTVGETRQVLVDLLSKLRDGDIWEITSKQAMDWLELARRVSSSRTRDEILSMRLRSLVAELADRRGWWQEVTPPALDNLGAIKTRFFSRNKILTPDTEETNWFRQAGWLLLQDARREHRSLNKQLESGAGVEDSPSEQHKNAARAALKSAKSLQKQLHVILPEAGNHELLYRAAFSIARHLQVLEEWPDAETELVAALHHCYQHRSEITQSMMILDPGDHEYIAQKQDLELKQKFTLFNTTVIVANLGRINVERGELLQALPQLLIARTMLLDSKDIVMRGFVDLLLGSVYRQLGAPISPPTNGVMLDPKNLLKSAIKSFRQAQHSQLHARATLELAQHYYGLAARSGDDLVELNVHLKEAEILLKEEPEVMSKKGSKMKTGRERWDAQRFLLLARIESLRPSVDSNNREAMKHALMALDFSVKAGRKDLESIARLVLAELSIEEQKYDAALKYCTQVEQLHPVDRADEAWLYVVFANAWMKQGDRATAEAYFERWESMSSLVPNVHIKKKAAEVKRGLDTQLGFYIRPNEDLNYEKLKDELKLFLVRSLNGTGTLEEQAEKLGVDKQTLANWRVEMTKAGKLEARPKFRPPRGSGRK